MLKRKKVKVLLTSVLLSLFTSQVAYAATYKVTSGDSLYKIGKMFGTTSSTIMKDNNLTSSVIYPGQALYVPAKVHTVVSGDTLYSIARTYGVTVDTIKKASGEWDNILYIGQKLNIPIVQATSGVIPYTQSDVDLLARLIKAEAEGQPYKAKVAVGAVVINRVKSSFFANTIRDVVYERINGYYQFTPVLNGQINKPATQEDINAAYEALSGNDPTNGALFYFDDSTTNTWLWSKTISLRVARMVYAY